MSVAPLRLSLAALLLSAAQLVAVSAPASSAAAVPAGMTEITSAEGITEYRLSNGLKVLLMPDSGKPTVTVNVTYLVGSRFENYGETGMAHLLEHMMFRGTSMHPNLDAEFNLRGMRSNASTSLDRTNYYEQFEARPDNLRWALQMEADRMTHSHIAKRDLDSEMTVVRNEFELGENSPENVMLKRMQSMAFDWHSYGKATIGNRSDIEHVDIAQLQAFYRLYYQPDNAVLLVSGKFDQRQTLAWIASAFGAISRPRRQLPVFHTVEPTQDGERQFIVRRKGDTQLVMVGYKVPSVLHPDSNALSIATDLLTNDPNGRLHKTLVDSGLAVSVFNSTVGSVDPGLLIVGAEVKSGQPLEPVRDALIGAVEGLADVPPDTEELDRLKRIDLNETEKVMADPESFGLELSESIALGDWRYFFRNRDQIQAVTSEQVSAAAARYFKRDNRVVGLFVPEDHPQRVEVPEAPDIRQVMLGFVPHPSMQSAETFDPSPGNIEQRSLYRNVGGLKVLILPKKNKGATVAVAIDLHWGDEQSLSGKRIISELTDEMLMRGSNVYNREQLSDQFSKLKITGDLSHFETTREHLPEALALIIQILKYPAFDADEFAQLKVQAIAELEAQRSDPNALAVQSLKQHFNHYPKGDWRYEPTIDEAIAEIKAVRLEDVVAFHTTMFGASHGQVAIVGDVDPGAAIKVLERELGSWTSWANYARVDEDFVPIPASRIELNTPDRENAIYVARLNFKLAETDDAYPAMELANYMLGGGADLDSRLMVRLRQKLGLSYGGGSELRINGLKGAASLQIDAIAAPQNLQQVAAVVRDELSLIAKRGFTPDEVARAKSGFLQQELQARSQDGELAEQAIKNLEVGRNFAWTQDFEARIKALTAAQVNTAFRQLVNPDELTEVLAYDHDKAKRVALH